MLGLNVRARVGARVAGLVAVLAAGLAVPAMASGAVTSITAGTGISLSTNPCVSTCTAALALPLSLTFSTTSPLVKLTNSSTTAGTGALNATGHTYGVLGTGGAGGEGVEGMGGTDGYGLVGHGGGSLAGLYAEGGATNGAGFVGVGQGTGDGIRGAGATTTGATGADGADVTGGDSTATAGDGGIGVLAAGGTGGSSGEPGDGVQASGYDGVYGTGDDVGVYGDGYYGVYADGSYEGVTGYADDYGVVGDGEDDGLYGYDFGTGSGDDGVYGGDSDSGTAGAGGYFASTNGLGVFAVGGYGGLVGETTTDNTAGVHGEDQSTDGGNAGLFTSSVGTGVTATSSGSTDSPIASGVVGTGNYYGVEGIDTTSASDGYAVFGDDIGDTAGYGGYFASTNGTAVDAYGDTYGIVASGSTDAGDFQGNVEISGTLNGETPEVTKIDDPAAPASKYLTQTAVQSPDAEDVYNGNVTTNARGFATVRLPDYFDAENIDPRYQLTPVGAKGWDARVGVWKQEAGNQFVIRSTIAGIEVSWQLTATRNDPASRALRAPAEQLKPAADQGKYLDPTAYGKPASAAIGTEQPGMKKPGVVKELAPARTKVPASIKSRSAQARQQIAKPAPLPPAPATPQVR